MQTRTSLLADQSHTQHSARSTLATQLRQSGATQVFDTRDTQSIQRQVQSKANQSSAVSQLTLLQAKMVGKAEVVQRVEEELVQSKFDPVQRAEEELLQGKLSNVQRVEDEEPLQAKFGPTQLVERTELNNTGLPNQLKSGIESLSGMSMDHVKVHYNSSQPAQLNAHAYAQGSEIHVAPGQEQHLPHEAWHVVQQAQGRVKPTRQMKSGVTVNDDAGLESEADVMGARALQTKSRSYTADSNHITRQLFSSVSTSPVQLATTIEYGPLTDFAFNYGKNKSVTGKVGTLMSAHLDPKKPEIGTDTSGSNAFNSLFDQLQSRTNSTWVRGHLLNHDLGGVAHYNNLFPLTTAANGEHYQEVEKQVKHWIGKKYEVDYQVKAEQIDTDGRGKFVCYAKPTTGGETDNIVHKTIYSMPYKVDSTREYDNKANTEVAKYSAVIPGEHNTVSRDQYVGKYTTNPKWKHKSGTSKANNRKVSDTLEEGDLNDILSLQDLSDDDQEIAHHTNLLANAIFEKFEQAPDMEIAEEVVRGHDPGDNFSNWLKVYKKEAGI